jgi:hypothetical protein
MWPGLIQKAKDGGLDVIQTYVFWNGHEPVKGQVLYPRLCFHFCCRRHEFTAGELNRVLG